MEQNLTPAAGTDPQLRARQSNRVVILGLLSNIILAILKTGIGILGHSPALLADGINSTSDVAYTFVVSIFVRMAHKPADEDHPYGHSQLESVGALVVGAFVITTAVAIFWNSINTLFDLFNGSGDYQGSAQFTLWIALGTIVVKTILSIYTKFIGRKTQNPAVQALAYDHRNDIFSASAAAIGIFFSQLGYFWVDPLAGAIVALVILRTGIVILKESSLDLMDTIPGKVLREQVESLIGTISEVKQIDDIHAHRFGQYLVINLTLGLDGNISVFEGDRISSLVEKTLLDNIEFLQNVHVHFHPYRKNPPPGKRSL
jgi:cation diffusion facilitator family transporter